MPCPPGRTGARGRRSTPAGRLSRLAVVGLAAVLSTAGCSAPAGGPAGAGDVTGVHVVASFYPLYWVTEQVGGQDIHVTDLTPPGAEPHDLELTPSAVAAVASADLVVYLNGFQPAVDDAVRRAHAGAAVDVGSAAHADRTYGDEADPHFWLDPTRLSAVADLVADKLTAVDPAHRDAYQERVEDVRTMLAALDGEYASGLSSCASRDLVTSHPAFAYLAERYALTQIGITGRDPESEPSPMRIAQVIDYVREHHVRTVYYEPLIGPQSAETVARETGAATAPLDPIESLSDASAGDDYPAIMRANLATLVAGQGCTS